MVSELEIVSAQLDEELEKSKISLCNGMFFQHEIEKVPVSGQLVLETDTAIPLNLVTTILKKQKTIIFV